MVARLRDASLLTRPALNSLRYVFAQDWLDGQLRVLISLSSLYSVLDTLLCLSVLSVANAVPSLLAACSSQLRIRIQQWINQLSPAI